MAILPYFYFPTRIISAHFALNPAPSLGQSELDGLEISFLGL